MAPSVPVSWYWLAVAILAGTLVGLVRPSEFLVSGWPSLSRRRNSVPELLLVGITFIGFLTDPDNSVASQWWLVVRLAGGLH